jgi:putative hemolysin
MYDIFYSSSLRKNVFILTDEIFSPHTLHSKGSLLMKYFLHHQPWNDRYEYQLTPDHFREEDTKMIEDINKQIDLLDKYVL